MKSSLIYVCFFTSTCFQRNLPTFVHRYFVFITSGIAQLLISLASFNLVSIFGTPHARAWFVHARHLTSNSCQISFYMFVVCFPRLKRDYFSQLPVIGGLGTYSNLWTCVCVKCRTETGRRIGCVEVEIIHDFVVKMLNSRSRRKIVFLLAIDNFIDVN